MDKDLYNRFIKSLKEHNVSIEALKKDIKKKIDTGNFNLDIIKKSMRSLIDLFRGSEFILEVLGSGFWVWKSRRPYRANSICQLPKFGRR